MAELHFDWDPKKNRDNQRDHKVAFEEAKTAFADAHGLLMVDPDHSDDEDRFAPEFEIAERGLLLFVIGQRVAGGRERWMAHETQQICARSTAERVERSEV